MPETLKEGLLEGVKVFSYASPKGGILKKHSWPLIIFKPGLGGCGQEYTILCEELASHGYVVLTVDQPYVSNFVRFLDGSAIVLTLRDAWYISRDRDYRYKYYDEAMAAAMAEIKFMLTHFQDINSTYFSGQLDPLSIVLMGHSFGGNIAHTLGFEDPRIKAVIDIDSKITERKIYGRVGVPPNPHQKPVLFIRGKMQYQEDVGSQLTKIHNAYIWEPAVEHSAFRDMAYLVRYHPHLRDKGIFSKFWNWFWKLGPLFDDVDTDVGDQEVNEWFGEYRTKIVQWLDKVAPSPVETEKLHMDFREKAL
jgi:dienelactone hydrolase